MDTRGFMAIESRWKDRWICIGGGTSGLGLDLAMQFARLGANLAIVGRDRVRGETAAMKLREGHSGEVLFFSLDLADEEGLENSEWKDWLATIDLAVAVAAAGKSDRGFLMQLTTPNLDALLCANLYSAFCFSKATLEALQRGSGTLVHIASLAGIVAPPGMGGYSIAKHSVVALSRQLRFELAEKNIRVLLVCPGPIERDSSDEGRYDELVEHRNLPAALKKPAAGANVKAIAPEFLSARIVSAIESGKKELVIPSKVRWLAGLGSLFPGLTDLLLKKKS